MTPLFDTTFYEKFKDTFVNWINDSNGLKYNSLLISVMISIFKICLLNFCWFSFSFSGMLSQILSPGSILQAQTHGNSNDYDSE